MTASNLYLSDGIITHELVVLSREGRIDKNDLILYSVVRSLQRGSFGCCIASNKALSEYLGTSQRTISASFSKLEKLGLVIIEYEKTKGKTYNQRRVWVVKETNPNHPHNRTRGYGNFLQEGIAGKCYINKGINRNKKHSPACNAGEGDISMPDRLVPHMGNGQKVHNVSGQAIRFAEILHEAVLEKRKITRPVRISSWAKQMDMLIQQVGHKVIRPILFWYVAHIGEQYIPEAWSGESFRLKFQKIKSAMERYQGRNPEVKVTQQAKDIARRLAAYDWPMGSATQLPTAIQISINNLEAFRARVAVHRSGSGLGRFADRVYLETSNTEHFLEVWFKKTWKDIKDWKDWSGKIPVLQVDGQRFQRLGMGIAQEYSGKPDLWLLLMKELGYEGNGTQRLNGKAGPDRDGG